MPHTYECPLRWADMDLLGHINNVTYLDYLAEARRHAFAGTPLADAGVSLHRIEFRSPLVFHRAPVLVDTWVTEVSEDELVVGHEIYDADGEDGRRSYLLAESALRHTVTEDERALLEGIRGERRETRPIASAERPPRSTFRVTLRRSDVGAAGSLTDVQHFELFQEARIKYLTGLHEEGRRWTHHVVARTDVEYLAPVPLREAAYDVHSWVGHLGTRSFTICAEIRDGAEVLARAGVVMVTFDKETQRPAEMRPAQRERLEVELNG